MKTKFQKISYWTSVSILGVVLGVSLQFVKAAWTEPASNDVNTTNVGAPINTSATAQTKTGDLTVNAGTFKNGIDVGVNGNQWSTIIMRDDESPNNIKYVHANSNVIGFLGGDGNWLSYWNQTGDVWNKATINASDFYIRASGKWASQLGGSTTPHDTTNCYWSPAMPDWQGLTYDCADGYFISSFHETSYNNARENWFVRCCKV